MTLLLPYLCSLGNIIAFTPTKDYYSIFVYNLKKGVGICQIRKKKNRKKYP